MNEMKNLLQIVMPLCVAGLLGCQGESSITQRVDSDTVEPIELTSQVVEASCGECQFGMEGNGCDLAVRIDGKSYYVDGTGMEDHDDAHGDHGMCNCVRHAKVSGEVKNERFVVTSFELLPPEDSADGTKPGSEGHNHGAHEH